MVSHPRLLSAVFRSVAVALMMLATACPNREVAEVPANPSKQIEKRVPVQLNRDVDILFVIDDSGSMREEQLSLADNFNAFISELQAIQGGLPNVHIGVVSTNVGAGPLLGDNRCLASDAGQLQANPLVPGCNPPNDAYISDIGDESGNRTPNYSDSLQETFSCIAQLGITGCGFEQPLESMRQALDNNPANTGFLRDNAFLAVIIISDEDDCSARNNGLFTPDASSLGPADSFRCFEYGVSCEPDDDPRALGQRQNCVARDDIRPHPVDPTVYLEPVQTYVDFLKSLKPGDPSKIIVAGIVGDPTPVEVIDVIKEGIPVREVAASCETPGTGKAAPSIRLQSFLNAFPGRSTQTSICNEDLSSALSLVGQLLAEVISTPCLQGDLLDRDSTTPGVQPDCTVSDVRFLNTELEEEGTLLPECNQDSSNQPCYVIAPDPAECPDTPTQLAITYERPESTASSTTSVVRCAEN